jgi:hypothetical protein
MSYAERVDFFERQTRAVAQTTSRRSALMRIGRSLVGSASSSDLRATVLDDFHDAAAKADGERYFEHFAPEGVFLGTDATERWTVEEFKAYAQPHFAVGKGWTYVPTDRNVTLSPNKSIAWFDELLQAPHMGQCRGSGVLRLIDGSWKISQYNLSIPVPNDLAKDVVRRVREFKGEPTPPESEPVR